MSLILPDVSCSHQVFPDHGADKGWWAEVRHETTYIGRSLYTLLAAGIEACTEQTNARHLIDSENAIHLIRAWCLWLWDGTESVPRDFHEKRDSWFQNIIATAGRLWRRLYKEFQSSPCDWNTNLASTAFRLLTYTVDKIKKLKLDQRMAPRFNTTHTTRQILKSLHHQISNWYMSTLTPFPLSAIQPIFLLTCWPILFSLLALWRMPWAKADRHILPWYHIININGICVWRFHLWESWNARDELDYQQSNNLVAALCFLYALQLWHQLQAHGVHWLLILNLQFSIDRSAWCHQ